VWKLGWQSYPCGQDMKMKKKIKVEEFDTDSPHVVLVQASQKKLGFLSKQGTAPA